MKMAKKVKIGDKVKFYYYYESKIGVISDISSDNKYTVLATNNIYYPITDSNITEFIKNE